MDLDFILDKRLDKDFLIQTFQEQKEVHTSAILAALTNKQPIAWRATWLLGHCTKKNDPRIQPYINDFINIINHRKEGHQREILKILNKMKLDDEQEGILFNIAMDLWEDITKAPALRCVAFKQIHKTCQKHPELQGEFSFICQEQYITSLSPGIQNSIRRMIDTAN